VIGTVWGRGYTVRDTAQTVVARPFATPSLRPERVAHPHELAA
jgi:hypothetical protein